MVTTLAVDMSALRGRNRSEELRERRRVDARRREHQMIAVLTVSIAVAFAAVTFLPTTEDAAAPDRPAPTTTAGPTSVTARPAVALASTVVTTAARATTTLVPPAPPLTAAAATTVAVVPPTSGSEPAPTTEPAPAARAAADLASYYVALAAGDRVGAFDHFAADLQAQVGGFDRFDDLWSTISTVRSTAAQCATPDDGAVVACRSVVEVDGVDGACTRSAAVTDLALIGTRYRIIGQSLEPGVPCAS